MRVRFTEGATLAQCEAVSAALEASGVRILPAAGSLEVRGAFDDKLAVEVAAMPGVEAVEPSTAGLPTTRDAILEWVAGAALIVGVLVVLAANLSSPLGQRADPLRTPDMLRPSWPLLTWYAAVDRSPSWVPVPLLFATAALLLLFWPTVARRFAERHAVLHTALGLTALLAAAGLAAIEVMR